MNIKKEFSLKKHNTFGIDVKAKYYAQVKSATDIQNILKKYPDEKILILGGGSNTLFLDNWDGLVLRIDIKGRKIIKEDDKYVYMSVGSGEDWDNFVRYTVKKNLSGIENMVMIPGTVGGAVSQNIGAYGQNITDTLNSIEIFDTESLDIKDIDPKECDFKYRYSKFKNGWRNKYIILSATFKLEKNSKEFELSYHERAGRYGSLKEELESHSKQPYSIKDVMNAVIRQRTKRLPSIDEYGTCGSFFQNPLVTFKKYKELSNSVSDLQCYPSEDLKYNLNKDDEFNDDDLVKIPAGRLLDELGWKGKWEGDVGVSEKHALCVVTNKKATGKEIYNFIRKMQEDIKKNYSVDLIPEVNIITNQENL
jgi:UDP-N-acetylmuramate dehydrogenase